MQSTYEVRDMLHGFKCDEFQKFEGVVSEEMSSMESLSEGTIIDDRFVLEGCIGQGGMGEVWMARQEPLGRTVAIKVLRPEFSLLSHLRRRFAREARAAARLSHEHIASIYDFGTDSHGRMYIAMEHVRGVALHKAMHSGLSVLHVLQVADGLLQGLAHAHARGVVHRDLKPENVLLAQASLPHSIGIAKIVDFGIATLVNDHLEHRDTAQDQVVGTPMYMSPEQACGVRNLSPRSDLYTLGMIIYEALAGFHPFEDEDMVKVMACHVSEPIPPLHAREGLVITSDMEAWVLKALDKIPEHRFSSAAHMRDELLPLLEYASLHASMQQVPATRVRAYLVDEDTERSMRKTRANNTVATVSMRALTSDVRDADMDQFPRIPHHLIHARGVPFVGRCLEREELGAMFSKIVRLEHGRIVMLAGEAGVGKTRLTIWLKEMLEERGTSSGHIGVFTQGSGGAVRGLQEVIESMCRSRVVAGPELRAHLIHCFEHWGHPADESEIQALIEFLRPTTLQDDSVQVASMATLLSTLLRVFEAASSSHPRLVVLDDVHWAGSELGELLELLAIEMKHRTMRVMLLLTMREDALLTRPSVAMRMQGLSRHEGESFHRMQIDRMTQSDGEALVGALLPTQEPLSKELTERGAGNPLHVIALLRYLVEQRLVIRQNGVWSAPDSEAVLEAVPPSLADLFSVRVRQLEDHYASGGRFKLLLQRGAVLGRRFSYDALASMIQLEGNKELCSSFEDDFDRLLEEGLITEVVGRGEEWYTFSSEMFRDAVLQDSLGPAKKRKLHCLAAEVLEQVNGARVDLVAVDIAAHWDAARRVPKAIAWYWRVGQMSRRSNLARQGIKAYSKVVALSEHALGVDSDVDSGAQNALPECWIKDSARFERALVDRSRYLRALIHKGDLFEGLGEFEHAEDIYRRVIKVCGCIDVSMPIEILVPLCQAWLGLGHVAWQRGDFPAAHWAFERVWKALDDSTIAPDIAHQALLGMARVAWHRGEYAEAMCFAWCVHDEAWERQDQMVVAESLWLLGEVARMLVDQSTALSFFERSLTIYRELGAFQGIARNLLSQAQLARYNKRFQAAQLLYEDAKHHYAAAGDQRGEALCYNGLGEIARFEGVYEDALMYYLRALSILEVMGAQYDMAVCYANVGLIEIKREDYVQAELYLVAALDLVQAHDYPYLVAGVEYNLALVKAKRGQGDESKKLLRTVLDLNERVPIKDLDFAEPLETLGGLEAAAGNSNQARHLWMKALAIYSELELEDDMGRIARSIEELDAHSGP